jgi:hypothetical protein
MEKGPPGENERKKSGPRRREPETVAQSASDPDKPPGPVGRGRELVAPFTDCSTTFRSECKSIFSFLFHFLAIGTGRLPVPTESTTRVPDVNYSWADIAP